MQFQIKGRVTTLLICCLILSGCASNGASNSDASNSDASNGRGFKWAKHTLLGAGIGGGLGGIAGAVTSTVAAPVAALGGAVLGGLICVFAKPKPEFPTEEDVLSPNEAMEEKAENSDAIDTAQKVLLAEEKLGSIYFETSSDQLDEKAKVVLKEIVDRVDSYKDIKIIFNGYTDNTGKPRFDNAGLAKRRAKSVNNHLRSLGVSIDRLFMGSGGIIEDNNSTVAGRKENRKVDIIATP
ncbi:MAG: OmpA family protein [Candidatus Endonucleobacter bathymodioli]|uniref:OmpA family protein n=1 Tax=Candidatus Endonucleibacter bathymodioli TaxID=539814 RepID=A0AA90SU17_9GAMM|nr:OmpA family protein [Candidatus Endonucleobacter bathymodioli]